MREDEIVRATVTAVHEFGIEIEVEGQQGFIQPTELSWIPESVAPNSVARVGDLIDVYVYSVTKMRFFASIRRAHPELNPWRDPGKFSIGSRHEGTVRGVFDWGCKVEIAEGVNGMIILEKYPGEYRVGDIIETEVTDAEPVLKKIELKPI
ncbi:S1 RNA-binding domain-containing protein [Sorangium sp. So ce1128]